MYIIQYISLKSNIKGKCKEIKGLKGTLQIRNDEKLIQRRQEKKCMMLQTITQVTNYDKGGMLK